MRQRFIRSAAMLFPLILAACGDLPTAPTVPEVSHAVPLRSDECQLRWDGTFVCPPQEPDWGECDPYHYDCGDDDCVSSNTSTDPDATTVQGCTGDGGDTGGTIGDGNDGYGGNGGPGGDSGGSSDPGCPDYGCPPPDDGECDPVIHPDCERPLTDADTATIHGSLRTQIRPQSQFSDTTAARVCGQMAGWFRQAMADGAVFRGSFDSDTTNDVGAHYGAYNPVTRHIHFDPAGLNAANGGNPDAILEIAITALHEGAHRAGFDNPNPPTLDSEGRDYYTDFPFNHLNPGPNSCIPR